MPSADPSTSSLTALLTLVNVTASKPNARKRTRISEADSPSRRKLGHSHLRAAHGSTAQSARTGADEAEAAEKALGMSKKERMSVRVVEALRDAARTKREAREEDEEEGEEVDLQRRAATATDGQAAQLTLAHDAESESEGEIDSRKHLSPPDMDGFEVHFGSHGKESHAEILSQLYPQIKEGSVRQLDWHHSQVAEEDIAKALGREASLSTVKGIDSVVAKPHPHAHSSLLKARKAAPLTIYQSALARLLGTHADMVDTRPLDRKTQRDRRQIIAMHAMSHLIKTRRRILRNNEKLAKAAASGVSLEVPRDQGYTRPTLLVLLPFRSSAYAWVQALFSASGLETLQGSERLESDFGPDPSKAFQAAQAEGASLDKPKDFLHTFAGNTDDNFKFGIKMNRKEMRLWTGWYVSDIVIASPLALRLAMEKDGDGDFLSSIELLVLDQAEVMNMQNWDHVQIPQSSHNTDFSRVRQWFLDDRALNLRQTILLSQYEMPELRAIHRALCNVAGKARSGAASEGVLGKVREGLRQTFTRFDCANLNVEADARFQHFTSRTLPNLLKSAVGASKTVIFVPSYFDFVRVEDHMRRSDLSFEAISEYSTPREVAASRQAFFTGKRAFLLVSERSHFYKRNTYRGAQTLLFYAPPQNPHFYTELLHWPFAPPKPRLDKDGRPKKKQKEEEKVQLDPTEVSALTIFSKFDRFALDRILGDQQAARMITEERSNWKFA